jgi:hypothetical protein
MSRKERTPAQSYGIAIILTCGILGSRFGVYNSTKIHATSKTCRTWNRTSLWAAFLAYGKNTTNKMYQALE